MNILVVNDDGPDSIGSFIISSYLKKMGINVLQVTPANNYSGCSASINFKKTLDFFYKNEEHIVLAGTPVDCVNFGIQYSAMRGYEFDHIVSGINEGLNFGITNRHSGTVQAAIEGFLHGIPSVAISTSNMSRENLEKISVFYYQLLPNLIDSNLAIKSILNINVSDEKVGCEDEFYFSDDSFRYIEPQINNENLNVTMAISTKKIVLPNLMIGNVQAGLEFIKMNKKSLDKIINLWKALK